jgi:hypothetical protein
LVKKDATARGFNVTPGRWPYAAGLALLNAQVALALPTARIWPRNSYLTSAFRPLRSDLDVTVWFEGSPGAGDIHRLRRILARSKRLFPALGEANVYCAPLSRSLAAFINYFELQRDPSLREILPSRQGPVAGERAAFLLRMLEADYHGLSRRPEKRAGKWRLHLQAVGARPELFEPRHAVRSILTAAWPDQGADFVDAATQAVTDYLESKMHGGRQDPEVPLNPWLGALFPHRFCFRADPAGPMTEALRPTTAALVAWEIWGMNSQFLLSRDSGGIYDHLQRLRTVAPDEASRIAISELAAAVQSPRVLARADAMPSPG